MMRFGTFILIILLLISSWIVLNGTFSGIGEFFQKKAEKFMRRATEEPVKPQQEETATEMEEVKDGSK